MHTLERYDGSIWTSSSAWATSLMLHSLIGWLIVTQLNSCGQQGDFGTGEVFREVGITYAEAETTPVETVDPTVAETPAPEELPQLPTPTESMPQPNPLPEMPELPLIGPGPKETIQQTPMTSETVAEQFPSPATQKSGVPSTTRFFDISTNGSRIVYVIDCSGSMNRNQAFRNAKAELLTSLQRLNSSHLFHVIFYSDQLYEFRGRTGKADVSIATADNLTLCRSFIAQMSSNGGTDHTLALLKAISYSPDVIFFLTDATESGMSAKKLSEIEKANRGRAAIHCIEFGIQPEELNLPNFLQRLSGNNGGSYRYRDTNQFVR